MASRASGVSEFVKTTIGTNSVKMKKDVLSQSNQVMLENLQKRRETIETSND